MYQADINDVTPTGDTPLHRAVFTGRLVSLTVVWVGREGTFTTLYQASKHDDVARCIKLTSML